MLSGQIEGLVALGDRLEALGHTVRIVSAFTLDQLRAERRWATDTADGAPLGPKLARILSIARAISAAARDCDLLHFNLPTPAFGALADVVQITVRRPAVVGFEAHLASVPATLARVAAAPEFYGPRIVINNGLVARVTLRRAQRYVVSSQYQRDELLALGYGRGHIEVIPNLVDTGKLARHPKAEARATLGLPDAPLVAFLGHYHDVKGHDVLIRAFPRILEAVPSARLVLGWSGIGNHARVQAEIARMGIGHAIVELGRVPVGELFSAADVVALPYRFSIGQAAFPGTVLEAMWVGVPLITTRLPLLEELVDHGRTGLLAAPGDADDLAVQTVRLLQDAAGCQRMVEAQRELTAERFNPDQLARAYQDLYERALAGQARVLQTA